MTLRALARELAGLLVVAGAVGATGFAVATRPSGETSVTPLRVTGGTGMVATRAAHPGEAILSAGNMRPGDSVRGTVRVESSASRPVRMAVWPRRLSLPPPGSGTGSLAGVLRLQILRRTASGANRARRRVYRGSLARMRPRALGIWNPGDSRRYVFRVRFPDHGEPASPEVGDNVYQGAQTAVTFVWGSRRPG